MSLITKDIFINSAKQERCVLVNGLPAGTYLSKVRIFEHDSFIFRFHIVNSAGEYVTQEAGQYWLGLTANHNEALKSVSDGNFNLESDWEDVDPTAGKVCARVDISTNEAIASLLSTASKADVSTDLWYAPDSREEWSLLCQFDCEIRNTLSPPTYEEASSSSSESSVSSISSISTLSSVSSASSNSSASSISSNSSSSNSSSVSSESSSSSTLVDSTSSQSGLVHPYTAINVTATGTDGAYYTGAYVWTTCAEGSAAFGDGNITEAYIHSEDGVAIPTNCRAIFKYNSYFGSDKWILSKLGVVHMAHTDTVNAYGDPTGDTWTIVDAALDTISVTVE